MDENIESFWQLLRDEKIIKNSNDDKRFQIHPSFEPILSSYLRRNPYSIMNGLMLAAQSYCPTASNMQLSVICNFITNMLSDNIRLCKQLQQEIAIAKIQNPSAPDIGLGEAMDYIKKDEQGR